MCRHLWCALLPAKLTQASSKPSFTLPHPRLYFCGGVFVNGFQHMHSCAEQTSMSCWGIHVMCRKSPGLQALPDQKLL